MVLGDIVEIELADSSPIGGGIICGMTYDVVDIWVQTRDGLMTLGVPRRWITPIGPRWKVQLPGLGVTTPGDGS